VVTNPQFQVRNPKSEITNRQVPDKWPCPASGTGLYFALNPCIQQSDRPRAGIAYRVRCYFRAASRRKRRTKAVLSAVEIPHPACDGASRSISALRDALRITDSTAISRLDLDRDSLASAAEQVIQQPLNGCNPLLRDESITVPDNH